MPPQAKFTRNEIITAALKIVEREGADKLTARTLGAELNSSSRPIFTVFDGMEEVQSEVLCLSNKIYGSYIEKGLSENPAFKGVGEAYIRFASERPKLFQLLFMCERSGINNKTDVLKGIEEHYEAIINSIENTYGFDRETSKDIYMHLWIYSHGIAVLIATKVCKFTFEQVSGMLTEIFVSLLKEYKSRK